MPDVSDPRRRGLMAALKIGDPRCIPIEPGLALTAAVVLLALSVGAGAASADSREHRNAENTYTKWIVGYPNMAGVVGGDVGAGTFAGEVVTRTVVGDGVVIDAIYHFNGSIHAFTAAAHVVQTGLTFGATSVINGEITDGWLKGNKVQGGYTVVQCTEAANGTCFNGWFDVLRGTKPGD